MTTLRHIRLREIRLPLKDSFRISSGVISDRRILLLELTDVNGVTTWSECVAGESPNYTPETIDTVLSVADIRLDPALRQVWRGETEVQLSNKEFRILEYLMRNPNRVLTRAMIADNVWDYDFPNVTNVIDVHVRWLRHKLDDPYPGKILQTVRGVGYRLIGVT